MATVRTQGHDFKVFFRRLVVPGELGTDADRVLSPSEVAGLFVTDVDTTKSPMVQDLIKKANSGQINQLIETIFKDYQPKQFKDGVKAKAMAVAQDFLKFRNEKTAELDSINKQIRDINAEIADNLVAIGPTLSQGHRQVLDDNVVQILSLDVRRYTSAATEETEVTLSNLFSTQNVLDGIKNKLGQLTPLEQTLFSQVGSILDTLRFKDPGPDERSALLANLAEGMRSIITLMSAGISATTKIVELKKTLSILNQKKANVESDISLLKNTLPLRPFYEPTLLYSTLGPYDFKGGPNRLGQPGTMSVSFHLPIDAQGAVPPLFIGLKGVDDIFNLSLIEAQPAGKNSNIREMQIPSQTLSILKPNLRETTILPFDMVQVWGRRRFSTTSNFPGDYVPVFTGFVTKTNVGYSGSTISVSITIEDVGKLLRLARVNIDPALDPRFRAAGINVTPYNNFLSSPLFKTGADLIEGLIKGASGTFLGMSQVEVLEKVENATVNGQTVTQFTPQTKIVQLAADFSDLKLNLFQDLLTRWKPYADQFKSAFRLWETDARTKWDVCREVADTTEFDFYADNLGVVNYHPPLYFLNPYAAQYLIEDVDIENESHVTDESEVLTVVEVTSQPSYVATPSALDASRNITALVAAPDAVIQRYGVRWQKKSVPIFSGIDPQIQNKNNDPKLQARYRDAGRQGYARAWMNRRNAKLKSATVMINGTPEIRICNTVAFVGDLQKVLKAISTNQMAAAASGKLGLKTTNAQSIPPGLKAVLDNVLVYYVSNVSHNYVQGGRYTTTLTLTHGRHWTDALPSGSVGFALDANDTDTVVQQMMAALGQGKPSDASAFAREINNKLQFIASGNPAFLKPQDNSQFGFAAHPAPASTGSKFRALLSLEVQGAVQRLRAGFCRKLLGAQDPAKADQLNKDMRKLESQIIGDLAAQAEQAIANALKPLTQLLAKIEKFGAQVATAFLGIPAKIAALKKTLKSLGLSSPSALANKALEAALNAELGGSNFKVIASQSVSAGSLLAKVSPIPLNSLGVDTSPITNFPGGVAVFLTLTKSTVGILNAKVIAYSNIRDQATKILHADNGGQLKWLYDATTDVRVFKHDSGNVYYVANTFIIGSTPDCSQS